MLAMGTSTGIIKIFSLKGYEQEIYDAHDHEICLVGFVPNKGLLVSIDVTNVLKLWDMEEGLDDCEVQICVPHPDPDNCKVSCLYIPAFLTNIQENHRHIFIGMESGSIYVFDTEAKTFADYVIDFKELGLPEQVAEDEDRVNDIKCHVTKMHRLLICYARTAIVVFSMNKNRRIQTLMIKDK